MVNRIRTDIEDDTKSALERLMAQNDAKQKEMVPLMVDYALGQCYDDFWEWIKQSSPASGINTINVKLERETIDLVDENSIISKKNLLSLCIRYCLSDRTGLDDTHPIRWNFAKYYRDQTRDDYEPLPPGSSIKKSTNPWAEGRDPLMDMSREELEEFAEMTTDSLGDEGWSA